jgi:hypothetical protein
VGGANRLPATLHRNGYCQELLEDLGKEKEMTSSSSNSGDMSTSINIITIIIAIIIAMSSKATGC